MMKIIIIFAFVELGIRRRHHIWEPDRASENILLKGKNDDDDDHQDIYFFVYQIGMTSS